MRTKQDVFAAADLLHQIQQADIRIFLHLLSPPRCLDDGRRIIVAPHVDAPFVMVEAPVHAGTVAPAAAVSVIDHDMPVRIRLAVAVVHDDVALFELRRVIRDSQTLRFGIGPELVAAFHAIVIFLRRKRGIARRSDGRPVDTAF